jgi:predicted dehydrogenase
MYVDDPQHVFQQTTWTGATTGQQIERYEWVKEDNHLKQLRHFSQAMQGLAGPKTTGEDGRKSLEVLLAVRLSALTGQEVRLPG